jgi:hypothetical protein
VEVRREEAEAKKQEPKQGQRSTSCPSTSGWHPRTNTESSVDLKIENQGDQSVPVAQGVEDGGID